MQNNRRVYLVDEDSAERNDVRLKRASEVSSGSAQMLLTGMGQLIESSDKELETYKQYAKKLSQEMAELIALTEREKDLMTNELHTSTEARKQLAEIRNEIRETEKELLTEELKSSREAVKQFSQEMNELREARKGLLTKELKSSREAVKQLSREINELRVFIETEKGILTKELKLFREAVTQLSQEINEERASRGREKELPQNELKTSRKSRRHFSQNKSERRAVSSSNESDEPVASRSTIFRKFQGFFGSSKSTRQGRRLFRKTQKEHKVNTEASPGMQLSAGPSHEHHLEYVQEHDKITDSPEISGSDEVESGSTASSGRCKAGPSLVKNIDSGKRHDKVMDSQRGLESDGEKQSRGMVPTSRSVDNYFRENQSDGALQQISGRIATRGAYHGTDDDYHFYRQIYRDPSQCTEMVPISRSVDNYVRLNQSDGALQQISGYFIPRLAPCGTEIYRDPSQCTGQLLPFRLAQSLPSLQHEMHIRDLPNSGIKIEQQPKSKKQQEGSEVIFELKVQEQDKDKYSYQWLKDGAELEGKCDAILILDNVELREFGWYKCRVCSRENSGINCESSRAWLDVVPKVQNATRLKKFVEVDLSTCDSIALYLNKDLLPGIGGYRQAAAVFGMTRDMIGALETCKSAGQEVIEFLKATKPDITVYTVCKQLKDDKMRRFDIAKILENHLTITESEV